MQCPIDGTELAMMERSGVEIDYCPKCRGVWLDRGELDKILERAAAAEPATRPVELREPAPPRAAPPRDYVEDRRRYRDDDDDADDRWRRPKRRDSFLSDLFDF